MKIWRNLTVLLFIIILAQVANVTAAPVSIQKNDVQINAVNIIDVHTLNDAYLEENSADSESDDLFNLPRLTRISPSLFSAELQAKPQYVLVIEFFQTKLKAALFKNLANPPSLLSWYEKPCLQSSCSRISGWKDGNSLYHSRITYHSFI
jgi:hypothetical protein